MSPKVIDQFSGKYYFLSNFYSSPISYGGRNYPTVEHLFQALKSLNDIDRDMIASAPTPREAKRLGRQVALRGDWEQVKFSVMKLAVQLKFDSHPDLRSRLIETGDAILIEGNTWGDQVWGVFNGEGLNLLGELLMILRTRYMKESIDS
jgi:ribA/ribD-fused uncharacterized protein